jgi:hypothetical protein
MAIKKISTEDLQRCFEAGLGVRGTARELKVTPGAISKRAKGLGITLRHISPKQGAIKDVVLYHAGDIVTKEINAVDQLHKINSYANELLDLLMRWNRGDDEALQILESQITNRKVRVGKEIEFVKEFKFKDPRELALKAMQEIRGQIQLQFEIFEGLYNMESIAEFQEAILTTIAEVEPDVRKRIVEKLKDRRILRSAIKCD